MAYSLVTYPDERLRVDHSKKIIVRDYINSLDVVFPIMERAMLDLNGIGIAAVQIGIHLPICIVGGIQVINPQIDGMSLELEEMYEGCLSCPGEKIKIARPKEIGVSYIEHNGNKVKRKKLTGLMARCFLHEFDHIRGKLIKDYSAN